MTGPAPADRHAVALRAVLEALDDAVDGTASMAAEVAVSWRDGVGAGWAARLDLLGRELARQAGVAAELLRVVEGLAGGADTPEPGHGVGGSAVTGHAVGGSAVTGPVVSGHAGDGPPTADRRGDPRAWPPSDSPQGWSLPGVRLGGTDGTRATERRGVVVPTLPDEPGG
ncbi:hypothetical protein EV383_5277 [Pseudonocardia sediminis]|uniref:Uncharacterized protein n=1 Tax=Pseudonocardia sediminis TaxID=1397368 RepID=A0A4Q7V3Z0_PSEST|nr:hypothetical protein [Pseudonocardia sediminis]RZT88338.1 hypothetical protein EV383_5277 [Pseudonocardia sediminis]